ncbi:hypothetical protein Hypma_011102 [Hypsizygus marmoreus]|uniref:Uncharacterized protein n=1 Tax=Hypsizygus marmoreus TaxID=39966 RepID=A0A369JQY4_HYPMA|nr:hypothetical protein Hypma_011102 [Hypsizygus marmoreus]
MEAGGNSEEDEDVNDSDEDAERVSWSHIWRPKAWELTQTTYSGSSYVRQKNMKSKNTPNGKQ